MRESNVSRTTIPGVLGRLRSRGAALVSVLVIVTAACSSAPTATNAPATAAAATAAAPTAAAPTAAAPTAAAPTAAAPTAAPSATAAGGGGVVNSLGVALPADAAPLDKQVFRFVGVEGKHFDVARDEYAGFAYEWAAEYLARRDANNVYHPASADSWEASADGLTWTFHLRKDAMWSDGVPVTADDWVFSLQRYMDPAMANPYAAFFYSVKNAEAVNKGTMPVDQLGVQKIDDYTFSITTNVPIPYFLDIANWHFLVPKHQVEKLGDAWADSPETAVSNGPFVIKEWQRGSKVVYGLNPNYTGPFKPNVERMELILAGANAPLLQLFQAKEVDSISLGGDQLAQTLSDPSMAGQVFPQGAFTTAYLFFDVTKPPFDDLKVRQAFSHAVDRDALKTVMQGLLVPAYGMLPEGFPCSQNDDPALRAIQGFDATTAKQLLADAGFPNGEGFPELEMWTRGGQYSREAEAIQSMLKETLGITVSVKDQERDFYMDQLAQHKIQFGLLQWGADYADPTNFLDWWGDQSRHTWKNDQFNQLINQARGELNQDTRCQLYHDAENILVSDVGAVFVEYPVVGTLFQAYVGGVPLNDKGLPGILTQVINPSVYIKQ